MYSRQRYNLLSPPFSKAPPTLRAAAVIGPVWVRRRHRSRRPFISSLGRWTLHLINNEGNFSILQPVCGHRAGILSPLVLSQSFAALSRNPALHWTLFERLVGELLRCSFVRRAGDRSGVPWVSTKTLVGSLFASFRIGWLSLSEGKAMGTPLSKTAGKAETAVEKPGEASASPSKTNGQVNCI